MADSSYKKDKRYYVIENQRIRSSSHGRIERSISEGHDKYRPNRSRISPPVKCQMKELRNITETGSLLQRRLGATPLRMRLPQR